MVVACPDILLEGEHHADVFGYHDITKGQEHWLGSPKRQELFGPLGITNIRNLRGFAEPDAGGDMMDVPDMDALNFIMQSPAAAEAMAHDGVAPETLVILVERKPRCERRREGAASCRTQATTTWAIAG